MSISDHMMWRYYELLTDVQITEIERMKREIHPMQAKKDLAERVVKDFHSADAASKAAGDWAKQFQRDETPENVTEVTIPLEAVAVNDSSGATISIRMDKLLKEAGLASSRTEAERKIKEGAVTVDGRAISAPVSELPASAEFILRVGKRVKKVRLSS
jgi:tyrosyl-tRNA synthetase